MVLEGKNNMFKEPCLLDNNVVGSGVRYLRKSLWRNVWGIYLARLTWKCLITTSAQGETQVPAPQLKNRVGLRKYISSKAIFMGLVYFHNLLTQSKNLTFKPLEDLDHKIMVSLIFLPVMHLFAYCRDDTNLWTLFIRIGCKTVCDVTPVDVQYRYYSFFFSCWASKRAERKYWTEPHNPTDSKRNTKRWIPTFVFQ